MRVVTLEEGKWTNLNSLKKESMKLKNDLEEINNTLNSRLMDIVDEFDLSTDGMILIGKKPCLIVLDPQELIEGNDVNVS